MLEQTLSCPKEVGWRLARTRRGVPDRQQVCSLFPTRSGLALAGQTGPRHYRVNGTLERGFLAGLTAPLLFELVPDSLSAAESVRCCRGVGGWEMNLRQLPVVVVPLLLLRFFLLPFFLLLF